MCRPGGPRCATDARRARDTALARQAEVDALIEAVRAEGKRPNARLRTRKANVDERVQHWQALYDSTPAGQREIEKAMTDATGDARIELSERLEKARELRAQELANARQNARKAKEGSSDDNGNEGDDRLHGGDSLGRGSRDVPPEPRAAAGDGAGRGGSDSGGVVGSGHPGADGDRPLLRVGGVEAPARRLPVGQRRAELRAAGVPSPDVYELDSSAAPGFRRAMEELKQGNRFHASVYVYEADEYREMRLFTTDDGKAGFALKGDEIVSVFAHRDSAHRGSTVALMAEAVEQGGRRLDCFDTALPRFYATAGFVPVARLRFDDEYAPDGWDFGTYARHNDGRPDVVFMGYDPSAVDGTYQPGAGEYVADYDEGLARVRDFLDG